MFVLLAAAAAATAQPVPDVAYTQMMRGEDGAAIARIAAESGTYDPAKCINVAIAHARRGESELARKHFQAVIDQRDVIELETSTGQWIDARTIARRGLAMLDRGQFLSAGQLARK